MVPVCLGYDATCQGLEIPAKTEVYPHCQPPPQVSGPRGVVASGCRGLGGGVGTSGGSGPRGVGRHGLEESGSWGVWASERRGLGGVRVSGGRGLWGSGSQGLGGSWPRGVRVSGPRGVVASGCQDLGASGGRGLGVSWPRGVVASGCQGLGASGGRGLGVSWPRGVVASGGGGRGLGASGCRGLGVSWPRGGVGPRGLGGSWPRGVEVSGPRGLGGVSGSRGLGASGGVRVSGPRGLGGVSGSRGLGASGLEEAEEVKRRRSHDWPDQGAAAGRPHLNGTAAGRSAGPWSPGPRSVAGGTEHISENRRHWGEGQFTKNCEWIEVGYSHSAL
ncbi:unnamed protein product [Boreogadus saida]